MTALRIRMIEDMKIRNLALNAQTSYLRQVSRFARHFHKSPDLLGPKDIRAYQVYLTEEKELASASITVAVSALRFLYKVTLHRNWNLEEIIPAPKKPEILPIILSPEEVLEFLSCVRLPNHRTILTCCYAAGLRISEALALQVSQIDSQRMMIRVEQGKGRKDRLRHALHQAIGNSPPMVATGTAPALAVSRRGSRKPHHARGGGQGPQEGTPKVSHLQTHYRTHHEEKPCDLRVLGVRRRTLAGLH